MFFADAPFTNLTVIPAVVLKRTCCFEDKTALGYFASKVNIVT
jgi:hypothetical protein